MNTPTKHRPLALILTLIAIQLLTTSCGKQIPKDIIQPDQMEAILYDNQLAKVMNDNISYGEKYKRELLRRSIYQKHGVTQAQFDSSLVWYTRHADELAEIYANLKLRFKKEEDHIKAVNAARDKSKQVSPSGDTVNVWTTPLSIILGPDPIHRYYTFILPTDSNYLDGDRYQLSAHCRFIPSSRPRITAAMSIKYANDSVIGASTTPSSDGNIKITLEPDSLWEQQQIGGMIYFTPDTLSQRAIISNIQLIRMHAPEPEQPADSVSNTGIEQDKQQKVKKVA